MAKQQSEPDTPVEVYGYKTDPLRRGYQILWNYESSYWRALVGADAWGLYEVLRSFCHKGNNICGPSINLLMVILGVKERRIITGRKTKVKGVEYRYPGLIDDLQHHELVIAEVKGKGPEMRYIFHVNLTPGLLTDEKLAQLPDLLQNKHTELLKRCEEAKKELAAKKRPSKVPRPEDNGDEGGSGNLPEGGGKLPEGSGNLPDKHYPYNTTQKTTDESQNSQLEQKKKTTTVAVKKQGVVVALTEKGISQKIAERLTSRYKTTRIYEKIDYLEYLLDFDPDKVKSPQGWLRRAIEEDYNAPASYQPKEAREAVANAQKEDEDVQQKLLDERLQQSAAEQEERRVKAVKQREMLRELYGTGQRELDLWPQVQPTLQSQMTKASYSKTLAKSQLLSLTDETALIGLPDQSVRDWVKGRLIPVVQRSLASHLDGRQLNLEFVVIGDRPNN